MSQMNHSVSRVQQRLAEPAGSTIRFSSLQFLIIIIGGIFLAEVIAMFVLINFRTWPYYLQTLMDATIMVFLIFPVVYYFALRPLLLLIEKRRLAEEQLGEMALFPALNPDAMLRVDASGRIEKTNPAAAQMGLSVGEQLSELIPDLREIDLVVSITSGTTQQIYETELNGHILQWVIRGVPELGVALLYSTDVTERNEIERQLRIQTAAMEAAANGIIITDPQGTIQWMNPAVTQISGYTGHELFGRNTRLFKSGKHDSDFYQQMWETILAGNVWHGETTNRRKDGSLYVEEQTITPVKNKNDQISQFIAIKQDITERKLIYTQLESSNRELRSLSTLERQQRLLAEGLMKSSIVLNMNLELDSVLDHIFEQTRYTIPYLVADIVLIKDGNAHVARQWGFDGHPEARTLLFEDGGLPVHEFSLWKTICDTQSRVLVPDTALEKQWEPYFGMTWLRSYLAAPLIYGDQVIGIINLGSDQANTFTNEMANSLRAFAASAAVAIQNARLYGAEQHNRKVAEILSKASIALSQTLDIQRVMETTLDCVHLILPFDIAFLMLSEGDDRFVIRCLRAGAREKSVSRLLNQSFDLLSSPIIKPFFEKQTSSLIPDAHKVEMWEPPGELASLRTWLGVPLISTGRIMGMVVVASAEPNFFQKDQIELTEAVVAQSTVALQNAWLFEQVRSGRQRLQLLSRHLVEVQENERKYIARELHDETGQALTSLKLGLHAIEQEAQKQGLIVKQVANLKLLADEILESLHRLAVNLRPASLDHLGLADALTSLVASTSQRAGIPARFKSLGDDRRDRLTEDIEASVYRIVQESLTNVIRHAHATRIDVILEWQAEKIVIIVEDDGVGIDLQSMPGGEQLGLLGMQERAEMLGGRFLVDSIPQTGTTLVVEIPYAHSNTHSR